MIRLHGKNFKCYDEFHQEFPIGKKTLIEGESGKGKTTILEAISFVLHDDRQVATWDIPSSRTVWVRMIIDNFIDIYRQKRSNQLKVEWKGALYQDQEAQSIIDQLFGDKKLWMLNGYMDSEFSGSFFSIASTDKMGVLRKIVLENPNEAGLMIQNFKKGVDTIRTELVRAQHQKETLYAGKLQFENNVPKLDGKYLLSKEDFIKMGFSTQNLQKQFDVVQDKLTLHRTELAVEKSRLKNLKIFIQQIQSDQEKSERERKENKLIIETFEITNVESLPPEIDSYTKKIEDHKLYKQWKKLQDQINLIGDVKRPPVDTLTVEKILHVLSTMSVPPEMIPQKIRECEEKLELIEQYKIKMKIESLQKTLSQGDQMKPLQEIEDRLGKLEMMKVTKLLKCPKCELIVHLENGLLQPVDEHYVEVPLTTINSEKAELFKQQLFLTEKLPRVKEEIAELAKLLKSSDVQSCPDEQAVRRELHTYQYYQSTLRSIGYNINTDYEGLQSDWRKFLEWEKLTQSLVNLKIDEKKRVNFLSLDSNLSEKQEELDTKRLSELKQLYNKEYAKLIEYNKHVTSLKFIEKQLENQAQKLIETKKECERVKEAIERLDKELHEDDSLSNYLRYQIHLEGVGIYNQHVKQTEEYINQLSLNVSGLIKLIEITKLEECTILNNMMENINIILDDVCTLMFKEDITVQISSQTENKTNSLLRNEVNINISYRKHKNVSFKDLSKGQKGRLHLAMTIAFALLNPIPILMIDELLVNLDSETKDVALHVLNEKFEGKTLIVIGHDFAGSKFDNVLTI